MRVMIEQMLYFDSQEADFHYCARCGKEVYNPEESLCYRCMDKALEESDFEEDE